MKELKEVTFLFLKLGLITFGGPAAHIALFEDEVVTKRKWMSRQHFLDLVVATNLIPGPNSTEMAIHCGYLKAGIPGFFVAGLSFTLPAFLIAGIFAYIYAKFGNLPEVKPFLYGIKPAIIVIILNAVHRLGRSAIKRWKLFLIAFSITLVGFLGINEIISIVAGGIFGALFIYLLESKNNLNLFSPFFFLSFTLLPSITSIVKEAEASLTTLFLTCLKIGAVWFGGGYILVAYFDGEFVRGLNWLTRQELLDAIAVGQFTPGPFLSSATFIGYQIAGVFGALAATIGIIIPSFVFVLILNPIIPRLRKSKLLSSFLDAVNVSAVAVMFVVGIKLGIEVIVDWQTWVIAVLSVTALFTIKKINVAYIIFGGAISGYLLMMIS